MPTKRKTPARSSKGGSDMGFLLGIVLLIVFGALFFIYGLPYLNGVTQTPQINVPNKIDVNVHQQ